MAGHRLRHREDTRGNEDGRSRRLASFRRWAIAITGGIFTLSGMNINNLGTNEAMAQPASRRAPAEAEDVSFLQGQATVAANAYRDYIITGDESKRTLYNTLYQRHHEDRVFMGRLHTELQRVAQDANVRPLLEAFTQDRHRVLGVRMEPVVMADFIEAAHNIRTRLARPRANQSDIEQRYGERLTRSLIARQPAELARRSVEALRDFILTGDTTRRAEYRRIFDANTSEAFTSAFGREFRSRIFEDRESGLAAIVQAYISAHEGGERALDPNAFAQAVEQIYRTATTGRAQDMEALRRQHNASFVDPLLGIVARGMARTAVSSFQDVLATGSSTSRDRFIQIYNGRFLGMPIEQNTVFWNEFSRLFGSEIGDHSSRTYALVRSFQRNILPIAIRDIYTELASESPDMARLHESYGQELVTLIAGNVGSLGWMLRSHSDIERETERRAGLQDTTATRLSSMPASFSVGAETHPRSRALAEAYQALLADRIARRGLQGLAVGDTRFQDLQTIEQNFDSLSWLSGTAAEVQRQVDSRARGTAPDTHAVAFRSRYGSRAGEVLSAAYRGVGSLRQARARLVSRYGQQFVDFVSNNLDSLDFVVLPVEQIEDQMRRRTGETIVSGIHTTRGGGFTVGTMATALRDIHRELGRRSPDRQRLERLYGREFVAFVADNRSSLDWLSGDVSSIESDLLDRTDDVTVRLREGLYGYSPVQLVSAIATARQAVSRGGIALAEARDSLGTIFVRPVVAREAMTRPAIGTRESRDARVEVEANWRRIQSEISQLERRMERPVLEPARTLLEARVSRWQELNNRIRREGRASHDTTTLRGLITRQTTLLNSMLSRRDLDRSVEMAFLMVHLAETGGDYTDVAGLAGTLTTTSDAGTLAESLRWYQSLARTGKQPVVEEIVASVMGRADPRLYRFIGRLGDRDYFDALTSIYNLAQGRQGADRGALIQRYGESAVNAMLPMIRSQAGNLGFLESTSASPSDITQARLGRENQLFAAIVIRTHRALTNPAEGEDRAAMVSLFGAGFVAAVEAQRGNLASLSTSGAGLREVRALPEATRRALFQHYPAAYARTARALLRAYRRQDEALLNAMSSIDGALREARPGEGATAAQRRSYTELTGRLGQTYGADLVRLVDTNRRRLRFLESASAGVADLNALDAALLEQLNRAYEGGPAVLRRDFMQNFIHTAHVLPSVYTRISNSLTFANATDQLPTNFREALQLYRQEFGQDDYLFSRYFNLPLLSRTIVALAQQHRIDLSALPPDLADGIDSPEELARFLARNEGAELIRAGRTFYTQIETQYLSERQRTGFDPDTGDLTTSAVQNLRSQLSIVDALYLGLALRNVSGTGSSFQAAAARSVMNSMLVIAQRDPYLVGPFLTQALPAFIQVSQDEETLVATIEAFNALFRARFATGQRRFSYSTTLQRDYWLRFFGRIADRLPSVTSTFDHSNLEDELRYIPEPRTDTGYERYGLYHPRPSFMRLRGLDRPPALYGAESQPLRLMPRPSAPRTAYLAVPGGFTLDSGAAGLFSDMYDQLRPPVARMFRRGIPSRFMIGALGQSTIIRRLHQLAGPMPTDYSDYWLSHLAEAGGYAAGSGGEGTTTVAGGLGAYGIHRATTGGLAESARWTRRVSTTAAGEEETAERTSTSDSVDIEARGGGLPYPMAGVIPLSLGVAEERGLHRGELDFHYEGATRPETTAEGATRETTYRRNIRGLLDTYSRIARTNQTDMLVYVAGKHIPELRDSSGQIVQTDQADQLRSRLYFITQEGNIYQLAYRRDQAQLLNYLYAGANTQQYLSGLRFLGRQLLTGDSAAAGFDGAAIGFSVPRGRGDTASVLALGSLVRNMSSMDPVYAEQALGAAITNILESGAQRDVYAAFYRGAQSVDVDPDDRTRIINPRFTTGTGEVMWRRMRIRPTASAMELRLVGGYPTTVGARWRHEIPRGRYRRIGYGISAGYSETDLLHEYRAFESEADQMYASMRNVLVGFHGWSEDRARDTGYLVSGSYMYSRLEDYTVRNADGTYTTTEEGPSGRPNPHYASLLMMYWARRHNILMGGQRSPALDQMYSRIENAMRRIQESPTSEQTILQNLSEQLRRDMSRDVWRFSLGYGYDGERVRIYTIASGQYTTREGTTATTTGSESNPYDETAYGNLYGLFLFGRPTRFYADVLGHGYGYSPLVISESGDPVAGTDSISVQRGSYSPMMDIYGGAGIVDWPSLQLMQFEREVTISGSSGHTGALRDCYRELGAEHPDIGRLQRIYNRDFVRLVMDNRESLSWMVRPVGQIESELRSRSEESTVSSFSGLVREGTAAAIRDIYLELRKAAPDMARLRRQYSREAISVVQANFHDLDWMLLPDTEVSSALASRARTGGSPEARLAGTTLPRPVSSETLTGAEVQAMFERNLAPVLAAVTNEESTIGLNPERYDVILGSNLRASTERQGRFYILTTSATSLPEGRGSIVIGNERDYDEWRRRGYFIGRGVTRMDVTRERGGDYRFVCSGDQRMRMFTAIRAIGGVTVPLTSEAYSQSRAGYDISRNWTAGGLLQLLQSHRTDVLAGAVYGIRQFGDEQWNQWTVSMSGRFQAHATSTMSNQLYGYVFFNRLTREATFVAEDEFDSVCRSQASLCQELGPLRRTTGGLGLTWARVNLTAGDRLNLHFFFEGGVEEMRASSAAASGEVPPMTSDFVFRTGLGFDWQRMTDRSAYGTTYGLHLTGQMGSWPLLPGEVTRPEHLRSYQQDILTSPGGWSVMGHLRIRW